MCVWGCGVVFNNKTNDDWGLTSNQKQWRPENDETSIVRGWQNCHRTLVLSTQNSVWDCNLRSSPGEIWNWPLYAEGKENQRKWQTTPEWSFNNMQGNLHTRLVLGIRILKVYIEALTGFSHIFSPNGLNTLLSQDYILELVAGMGTVGGTHIPRTGEGIRSLWLSR